MLQRKAQYTPIYNRKNKLNKDGKALVQIKAYLLGKSKYFSTGIYLKPSEWNIKKREVGSRNRNYINLNIRIRKQIDSYESLEAKYQLENKPFSLNELEKAQAKEIQSFTEFYANEIELRIKELKASSLKEHRSSLKILKEFRGNILFTQINYELLADFEHYLIGKDLHTNYIHKIFKNFRTYLNRAIKKDLFDMNKNPFLRFKLKRVESKRDFLTIEELKTIEELDFSSEESHLEVIKDLFLFGCYTGLRFQDVLDLQKKHIKKTESNSYYISKVLIKTEKLTEKPIYLPISDLFQEKAVEIVEKYSGNKGIFVFERLTNQYVNRALKVVAERCNIDKTVTFHVSRHTFATSLLEIGMNIEVLRKLMGHKKIETTLIYAKMLKTGIDNAVQKLDFDFDKHLKSTQKDYKFKLQRVG